MERSGSIGSAWRAMFVIGVLPALLSLFVFKKLKEPERWKAAASKHDTEAEEGLAAEPKLGSLRELFGDPSFVVVGFPSSVAYEGEVGALARERPDHIGGLAGGQSRFELVAPMEVPR